MEKLLRGIVEFRQKTLPSYKETFARLALGQSPDSLFIVCSDSRVAPNVFASTDPGDLFVIRNVGNLVPCCGDGGISDTDVSEAAAIEFAILSLKVKDIIVCGHSECGAMHAILNETAPLLQETPHLRAWLKHGKDALEALLAAGGPGVGCRDSRIDPNLAPQNQLSQLNVMQQIEHLKSYPIVADRVAKGTLKLHSWWFDIRFADVYRFSETRGRFVIIDEVEAGLLSKRFVEDTEKTP
jgi:carbonic anhydrase